MKRGNYPSECVGEIDRNHFSGGAGDKLLMIRRFDREGVCV